MTLILETGGGTPNANSYCSLDEANDYHTLYNNLDWAGTDAELEQALILATQSVDLLYGPKYLSWKKIESLGPLLFPRLWFYDNNYQIVTQDMIPQALKNAVCEIALLQLSGLDIFPQANTDGNVKLGKVKVGDIEIENQYVGKRSSDGSEVETFAGFRKIDLILQPLLKTKQSKVFIVR
jgi:hypothetical protein